MDPKSKSNSNRTRLEKVLRRLNISELKEILAYVQSKASKKV